MEILPPLVKSSQIVGGVSQAAAEATGLLAGTPVVGGGADNALWCSRVPELYSLAGR